jgi:hypothetical protein
MDLPETQALCSAEPRCKPGWIVEGPCDEVEDGLTIFIERLDNGGGLTLSGKVEAVLGQEHGPTDRQNTGLGRYCNKIQIISMDIVHPLGGCVRLLVELGPKLLKGREPDVLERLPRCR